MFPPYAHLPKRLKGAVLKTARSSNRRGGSNPPVGAIYGVIGEVINTPDCGSGIRRFDSYMELNNKEDSTSVRLNVT